jgi:hypothetical protein
MPNDLYPPGSPLPGHRSFSQIFAFFPGGRGVVSNMTFGFWAASIASTICTGFFLFTGDHEHAIAGLLIPYLIYLLFLGINWVAVSKNPDVAVSGDSDYARIAAKRLISAAKDPTIMDSRPPIIGEGGIGNGP